MTVEVLGDLIDGSSVGGATFELGSACFDSMCVLTGQLDAYLEPGPRLIAEIPSARAAFERVGNGHVLNNSPYDLAAAVLPARGGRRRRHRRDRPHRCATGRCWAPAPTTR